MKRIIEIDDELYKKIMGHRALTKYQEHIDYEDLKNMVEDSTPLNEVEAEDCISRKQAQDEVYWKCQRWSLSKASGGYGQDVWNDYMISSKDAMQVLKDLPTVYQKSDKPSEADLIKANTQLKKQIEMLKLDRECDKPSGKWINNTHTSGCGITFLDYECSCCHGHADAPSDYCPNCGVRLMI